MIEDAVHQLLSESAQNTLETMFFSTPDSVSMDTGRPAGALIASSLTFQGAPPGHFGLLVSDPLARALAANFTASDDAACLAPAQVAEVMGELCNMMCGVALSELESDANFDLSPPQSIHLGVDQPAPDFNVGSPSICRFEFPQGSLLFFLRFEEPV
jgi:hypothetical protein